MKQLYIRKGNLDENRRILIIGEEAELGSRDSAYSPKGTLHQRLSRDPYTGAENLSYVHACKNILLVSSKYKSDHDVHDFVKHFCKDLVTWDGESRQGITNSREAFICKSKNVNKTVRILRKRIQAVVKPENFKQWLQKIYYGIVTKKKKVTRKQRLRRLKICLIICTFLALQFYPKTKPTMIKIEKSIYNGIDALVYNIKNYKK
jgi:hypothetical protein